MNILQKTTKSRTVSKFLILCLLFSSSCSIKKTEIEKADREDLLSFINEFFFVNSGVYTLFGDKPISEMLMFTGSEQDLIELTEEEQKNAISLDSSIVRKWKVWRKYIDNIHSPRFIFTKRPCSDPSHTIYAILNKKSVREILKKHATAFEKLIGNPFDINQVVEEFKDPSSNFWQKISEDHFLLGLLFGYGEENVQYFLKHLKTNNGSIQFSDRYNPTATASHFPLPSFALSPEDATMTRYQKQRTQIQRIYQDQDIIDTTFRAIRN